jgi:hypothetical protein
VSVKLTPLQWVQLISAALPLLRGAWKLAGMGAVAFIKHLVKLIGALEEAFPNEPEQPGQPARRRGAERLEELKEAVATMFEAAGQHFEIFEKAWPSIVAFVTYAVEALKKWKAFVQPQAEGLRAK